MVAGFGELLGPIYIADFDTAKLRPVYIDNQLVSGYSPSISPSGELIVFLDLDLHQIRVVQRLSPHHEVLRLPINDIPTWSPQGDRFAVIGKSYNKISVQIFNLEGNELSEVSVTDDPVWLSPHEIAWSPDGKKLAFSLTRKSAVENEDQRDIFVLWLEDGHISQITETPTVTEEWPSWSPDSNLLVFTSSPIAPGPTGKIAFTDIVGKCEKIIPQPESVISTAWSPEGNQIAVANLSGSVQIFDIASLDPDFTSGIQICP